MVGFSFSFAFRPAGGQEKKERKKEALLSVSRMYLSFRRKDTVSSIACMMMIALQKSRAVASRQSSEKSQAACFISEKVSSIGAVRKTL